MTHSSIAIAVFVKTPEYSPLKTRLAADIGSAAAEEFHQLAVGCVEETLIELREALPEELHAIWSIAEPEAFAEPLWSQFESMGQGTGDLGDRLHHVYSTLIEKHDIVLLMGADSPQLASGSIRAVIEYLLTEGSSPFGMIPANDGGFVLFGGTKPIDRKIWKQVPYSVDETFERLIAELRRSGETERFPEQVDVDTWDDLQLLLSELKTRPAGSAKENLWLWIQEQISRRA